MAKPRILIVDDDPQMLSVLARALELIDYDTQIAATAMAAMELVESAPPDGIMVDLKMPYVNGLGFLYRVRAAHPHMPVAIITASSDLDDVILAEIRTLGADLRFKPLPIAEIQALAREWAARRRK